MLKVHLLITAALVLTACTPNTTSEDLSEKKRETTQSAELTARISSSSIVTAKLDETIAFYEKYLGYKTLQRKTITETKSLKVIGAGDQSEVRYATLVPAHWSKETPNMAGINLMEIPEIKRSPFSQNVKRVSRAGEPILSHRVTNIEEINRRVLADGIPVVAALSKSGSGRSMSMSILDPNGIRIEMYEY